MCVQLTMTRHESATPHCWALQQIRTHANLVLGRVICAVYPAVKRSTLACERLLAEAPHSPPAELRCHRARRKPPNCTQISATASIINIYVHILIFLTWRVPLEFTLGPTVSFFPSAVSLFNHVFLCISRNCAALLLLLLLDEIAGAFAGVVVVVLAAGTAAAAAAISFLSDIF